jgi:hypothetical protein
MSILNDPKHASRALIAIGGTIVGLCAKFGSQSAEPYWLIGMYVGFVMLIRGLWLAWKSRRL